MRRIIGIKAPAKVNLYLDITGRRGDGYHLLETIMQSVSLYDEVTVEYSDSGTGKITVECDRADIPSDERNIAYKAARLFLERSGERNADISINIKKHIPSGAGMGGGSTDAAAVIAALSNCIRATRRELYEIAEQVGADVPFCLCGGTAVCRGIGEDINVLSPLENCAFLVVKPDFSCPTGEAYSRYDQSPLAARGGLNDFEQEMRRGVFSGMYNVFRGLYADARIEKIIERLSAGGALGAMLTGSGSAVFGVFADESAAAECAARFGELFTAVCRPCEGLLLEKICDNAERTGL
ncbi:MAG: 4-(cytidine 5'-diphospho)-2-C-methyl-D-erythritol kinase [Oscillospiraceae bacterium]